jgi:transcriptional regulator, gntR family
MYIQIFPAKICQARYLCLYLASTKLFAPDFQASESDLQNAMVELPRYKQVYETLRRHIAEGVYSAGDLLPSEHELSIVHRVARPTVRRALDQLVADGFILKHQGKGSIVKGVPKGIGILSLTGTTSAVGREDFLTHIILRPEVRSWTEAFSFPVTPYEQEVGCIYFERLRLLNGEPVFLDITMLPNINLPRFTSYNLENTSLFDFLRTKYQIVVTGGTQQLYAIRADKRLQEHLRVKPGHPILQLDRKIETSRPGFHIYSQVFCATRGYGLRGTF